MKPTTKLEKEVTWISSHLLPPSMEQIEDAKQKMFPAKAYYTKKNGYSCLECGHNFRVPDMDEKTIVCPHCKKALMVERTRKHRETICKFYMLIQTVYHNDTQFVVQRLYEFNKILRKSEASRYSILEISEHYTTTEKQVCLGLPLNYFGKWNYSCEMSIKRKHKYPSYYGGSWNSYHVEPDYYCFESVAPVLERNGFRKKFHNFYPQPFVRLLMTNPNFEKLYKMGGDRFLDYYEEDILQQLKIVKRHSYRIYDPGIWVDTIRLLRSLNMDDRNPRYVCPTDLAAFHNELVAKKRRKDKKLREEAQRRADLEKLGREKKIADEYVKRIARFLQLSIQDEMIQITPIQTVYDVYLEGQAMHHCVYECGYYKKPDVLLLTARTHSGTRVETIEVNLEKYQVMQSRGVSNSNTEHHERILKLLSENMDKIKSMHLKKTEPTNINLNAA